VRQLDASEKEEVFDCAMAWHGMAWHGMAWHGIACCCSRVGYAKMWKDLLMPVACTGRRTSILNKILVGIHP
jgi:hypothetical protein